MTTEPAEEEGSGRTAKLSTEQRPDVVSMSYERKRSNWKKPSNDASDLPCSENADHRAS